MIGKHIVTSHQGGWLPAFLCSPYTNWGWKDFKYSDASNAHKLCQNAWPWRILDIRDLTILTYLIVEITQPILVGSHSQAKTRCVNTVLFSRGLHDCSGILYRVWRVYPTVWWLSASQMRYVSPLSRREDCWGLSSKACCLLKCFWSNCHFLWKAQLWKEGIS